MTRHRQSLQSAVTPCLERREASLFLDRQETARAQIAHKVGGARPQYLPLQRGCAYSSYVDGLFVCLLPFGEDVISFTGDPSGKQPLESKKSLPLESLATQESGDGRDREPCRTPSPITQPSAAQRVDKDRAGSPGGSNLSNGEVPGGVTEPR